MGRRHRREQQILKDGSLKYNLLKLVKKNKGYRVMIIYLLYLLSETWGDPIPLVLNLVLDTLKKSPSEVEKAIKEFKEIKRCLPS